MLLFREIRKIVEMTLPLLPYDSAWTELRQDVVKDIAYSRERPLESLPLIESRRQSLA
jgi:hypothetical protein